MKKIWIGAIAGLLFLGSCAQKKENREEFKAEHNKDSLRNMMGDSAVANSETNTGSDTTNLANDTLKKPTDYKSKESRPNTEVGGSR